MLKTRVVSGFPLASLAAAVVTAGALLAACGGTSPAYEISVSFNDRYTDAAGAAVEDAIHQFDSGATVFLQTSFPPVAHATIHTDDAGVCTTLRDRLMSRPDVADVSCGAR